MEEKQHTVIMTGLRALVEERGWEVTVVPLVADPRSVRRLVEYVRSLYQPAAATREGHIGPDPPVSPGRLEQRGIERVGRC